MVKLFNKESIEENNREFMIKNTAEDTKECHSNRGLKQANGDIKINISHFG